MDIEGVRTFVAIADAGQFQVAASELHVTQQAVSKRIAALERALGVTLFTRTARGSQLTVDGQAFLPHAREFLRVAVRAVESVQPGKRALRVDVVHRRIAPAVVLQDFYRAHPDIEIDVVTLGAETVADAVAAVRDGVIDASFRSLPVGARLPADIKANPTLDSALELLVGPQHPLAAAPTLRPRQLEGHRIWVPGIIEGSEWAAYYADLTDAFGLSIDALGPHFGDEALMEQIATSPGLATIVGDRDRYLWPAHYDLRRVPLHDPTPVYPHSLIWSKTNPHPGIPALRKYVSQLSADSQPDEVWRPDASARRTS